MALTPSLFECSFCQIQLEPREYVRVRSVPSAREPHGRCVFLIYCCCCSVPAYVDKFITMLSRERIVVQATAEVHTERDSRHAGGCPRFAVTWAVALVNGGRQIKQW